MAARPPLRRLTGFQSELRNPGLPCGLCPGLAPPKAARGRRGGSAAPAAPARPRLSHTHTPLSHRPGAALLSGDNHLLPPAPPPLVAFTISISSSAPRGSQRHHPPSPALHPGSPQASFTLTEPPAPSLMFLLLLLVLPFGLGLARGGRGGVGSLDPGFGSWCSWKEQLCSQPSHHQHLIPGAAVPHPLCSRGSPGTGAPHVQSPVSLTCGLSPPECWHRAGAAPRAQSPECLPWGGSWLMLPSRRARGSGCGAALPSPPHPPG